jgi:hypothetical protein
MPADALVLVPRICGICSVAQSVAAALALADAAGSSPPPNGRLAANLTLATENLADHLTHFYLFFMPDFARADYTASRWHAATVERFRAIAGSAPNEVLPARARFMQMMGLLAGKWPHTLAVQPGGSTRPLQSSEIFRLHRILRDFRRFLERTTFGCRLEEVAALSSRNELSAWQQQAGGGDLRPFSAHRRRSRLVASRAWQRPIHELRVLSRSRGAPVSRRVLGSTIPATRYHPDQRRHFPCLVCGRRFAATSGERRHSADGR